MTSFNKAEPKPIPQNSFNTLIPTSPICATVNSDAALTEAIPTIFSSAKANSNKLFSLSYKSANCRLNISSLKPKPTSSMIKKSVSSAIFWLTCNKAAASSGIASLSVISTSLIPLPTLSKCDSEIFQPVFPLQATRLYADFHPDHL